MAGSIKSSCQKRKYHIPEDGPKDRHGKLAQPIIEINPSTAASKATSRSSPADPSNFESDSLNLQPSANTADVSAFQQAHFRLMRDPSLGEGILLNGAQFVHLLDTGGQPSFQAVLPLLLDVPCTYVLVFNAAEGLNAPVPITYRPDDTTVVESGSRPETAWAMMLRSLSSVYTLVHKVSGDVRALLVDNRLPPLRTVLVGTFADQLEQMGNIAIATEEIGRQIKQLENKPYYSSLIPNSEGQLFHLVNNLPRQEVSERTRREQASINNLREVLSHPAGALNAKIPIGWYQFEMVSRMVDQKFFKFSELLDHARELKCITSADPSREFRSLLQLFHSLGVFTFIDREDVSHTVCTDSSVFLQVVSKLLAVDFKIPKCIAVRIFKETGILSLDTSLFNELGISKEVDPVWLLRCLCYLGVAACLSLPSADTLEYFIPAALPIEDKENVSEHGSVAPLMVAFQFQANAFLSTEDLPHGIFARLAVELANKGWKVIRKKNTHLAIRFRWEELTISIVESAGCIRIVPIVSIRAKCSVAELHERCTEVRSTVEAAIQTSARAVFGSKFTEKAKPIFIFECPCEALPTHLAVPSGNTLVCNLTSDDQEYLTSQKVWFCPIEGAQLQPHPSNRTILQLVDPTPGGGGGGGGGDSLQSSNVTRMGTLQTGKRQQRVHAQLNPASCSKKRVMSPQKAASTFPVSELLTKHEPEFFSVVNARFSLRRLKRLGVITQDVMAHIDAATNEEDAQEILYEHLANHASVDTLMKYCEVIVAADGYPKMKSLGRKMMEELQPKEVSSLQAGSGSDPPEREDTSNLLTDEAALKDLCWIPFDIKTVSIEAKGGILCLEPESEVLRGRKEDTIFVEVPPDAVGTSANVKMRYAIIPSGAFTLPEGYQLGSPVVYIYYDGRYVTKPLALHLPHWYGGEDHAKDGLSFAVAPHSLKGRGVYHFQLLAGGKFPVTSRYGVVEIGGHCSLFATAFKNGATVYCQAFSLIKEIEEETECKADCNIAVTNAAHCWRRILLENRPGWEVSLPNLFQFKSDRITATLKEKSRVRGDWRAYFTGASELLSSHVQYSVSGIHSEKALKDAVKDYAYPPAIKYIVKYRKELRSTGRSTEVTLHISDTNPPMDFPYTAYERIQGEFSLRKQSSEGALQDQPPAKRVIRCAFTGSEGTVEALGVSSSSSVVSGGAVAAERSLPICEDATDSPQSDDAILSEIVSDHPRHLMLFRRHISRRAAGKGRAVLEGVGLDAPTMAACFTAHPLNEEGAVQEGLTKWCGGKGVQPPTWRVLVEAIEYANIAQQDIEALKSALSSSCLQ